MPQHPHAEEMRALRLALEQHKLRTDLLAISAAFIPAELPSTKQQRERYSVIGRWHAYAWMNPGLPQFTIYPLQDWFVALAEADEAITALVRLRKKPYPTDKLLTATDLKNIAAHRHIEKLGALIALKEELDSATSTSQIPIGVIDPCGSLLGGWSWRPRLEFLLDFLPKGLPEMLRQLNAALRTHLSDLPDEAVKQRVARLELKKDLNLVVDFCRQLAISRTGAAPLTPSSTEAERRRRLSQARREEHEWMRQPRRVCDRWTRLFKTIIQKHKEVYATYCVLSLEDSTIIDPDWHPSPTWRNPRKSTRARLVSQFDALIKTIKKSGLGLAYFKKMDWTPQLGDFFVLILLHRDDQRRLGKDSVFGEVKKLWTFNEGARIASPLNDSDETAPGTSCFRINNGLEASTFEASLRFLTLGAQQARIRSETRLERFRCESLQAKEKPLRRSRLISTKRLVSNIREERGELNVAISMSNQNRGALVTMILIMIDRWLNKFGRVAKHQLFKITEQHNASQLNASVLGHQLLTLLAAMPLLVGSRRVNGHGQDDWYPLNHPLLQHELKTAKFLAHYRALDAQGKSDQTGWYYTQPQISVPLLNEWTRSLARRLRHPMFRGSVARWTETSGKIHHDLYRVMVKEFANRHQNHSVMEFDLAMPHSDSTIFSDHLVKNYQHFKAALNRWFRRLADRKFPAARIALRIDVNPGTQQLVGRGLLITASAQFLPEAHRSMGLEWQSIEPSPIANARIPRSHPGLVPEGLDAVSGALLSQLPAAPLGAHLDSPGQAIRLKRRIAMLGLIASFERFNPQLCGPSLMVWSFDEMGQTQRIHQSY